ncbi:HigA family addiction module antitoxin [Nitrospira sp. BLG_1]|uniref:HigA family addiction module antitoxin n=1 Tax=Nitrospira sp. BLG_1 TaxID=3395883 RepID=UPI0039BC9D8A
MCKKRLPPIHPGEILRKEFIQPLNLSANTLAQRLGVTTTRVNEIANERRGIMAGTALRLARCFSTTLEFWMNLQQRCELEAIRRAVGIAVEREVVALDLGR